MPAHTRLLPSALALAFALACATGDPPPAEPSPVVKPALKAVRVGPVKKKVRPPQSIDLPLVEDTEVEPNDGWEQAQALGASMSGAVEPKAEDWFAVEVTRAGWYLLAFDGPVRRVRLRSMKRELMQMTARKRAQHLYLTPGAYRISVHGGSKGGEYSLWFLPQDVPADTEREPNDEVAETLALGEHRRGVMDGEDRERFRFHLDNRSLVRVDHPSSAPFTLVIEDLDARRKVRHGKTEDDHWEGWLEAGDHRIALHAKTEVSWELEVSTEGSASTPAREIPVAAFRDVAQRVRWTEASGGSWWASDARVQVTLTPAAGAVEVVAALPADLHEPVRVGVGEPKMWTTLMPRCDGPLSEPHPEIQLPTALSGLEDVARVDRGAAVSGPKHAALLLDGLTPNDVGLKPREPVVVDLRGDGPVQVRGFVLDTQGKRENEGPVPFTVELSSDGSTYVEALTGELLRGRWPQAFVLAQGVPATHARLTVDGYLGAFSVAAEPLPEAVDLADAAFGGFVVRSRPKVTLPQGGKPRIFRGTKEGPLEIVLGFEHQRQARLDRVVWEQGSKGRPVRRMAVSTASTPIGPWTIAGSLEIPETGAGELALDGVRARYLKLTRTDDGKGGALPHRVQVFEAAGESITHLGRKYRQGSRTEVTIEAGEKGENDTRALATAWVPGTEVSGTVTLGEDIDVFELQVPPGENKLQLKLDSSFNGLVQVEQAGVVALEREVRPDGLYFSGFVQPGSVFVTLSEPKRNVALLWDQSGSVSPYLPRLMSAIDTYVEGVQPGREVANLLPFGHEGFLSEDWSDDPAHLQRVLADDDGTDKSSAAEDAMLMAVRAMQGLEGSKAIVILTDADTSGTARSGELWSRLEHVRPRVFSIELHRGKARVHQDRMQAWSQIEHGHYAWFRTAHDLDSAFERATCMLRRPISYTLSATLSHEEPPEPGLVVVKVDGLPGHAVELVLDASGSMLQRVGGKTRMQIAKDVLGGLVRDTLPAGTPVALRVFGHRKPGACDTSLEVPLVAVEGGAVKAALASVQAKNLAKTPIAASLEAVAADLKGHHGPKLVVLVTDGEETCGGDVSAAIEGLEAAGLDVRTNIVGFAIDDARVKADFEGWAKTGGGLYLDAATEAELGKAMAAALAPAVEIADANGVVIARGVADGVGISVPPGTYEVTVQTVPPTHHQVTVTAGDTHTL